ncbi:hypothetical protein GM921_00530 [Pedobacter sp. LMG 31464]|uniref:RteC protein n=1 Tax=Pedobacter planticolens TaxID=2679964 RepID=A0A923ISU9_9SPHI|nr:RteC domain-containing protein [Pedobacter planticolens]MBB2143955.1 hypothetical protein [Pedobacter planticolens]
MNKKCDALLSKLQGELTKVENGQFSVLEILRSSLFLIQRALDELRTVVVKGFSSEQEEIDFFKVIKPKCYSQLIYVTERYGFENGKPVLVSEYSAYCKEQLNYFSLFFRQHEFLYQYYRLGAQEMDSVYFVRGADVGGVMGLGVPELDPAFATAGDYLFSTFMAYEKMQAFILAELQAPVALVGSDLMSKKGRKLRWTGEVTNLIELLYGLFETKQFNEGDVDISDMVDVFEQAFEVNLSNFYRRFTTIKRRKSISKTRFLDELRDTVAKRIDDADAYVPAWAK